MRLGPATCHSAAVKSRQVRLPASSAVGWWIDGWAHGRRLTRAALAPHPTGHCNRREPECAALQPPHSSWLGAIGCEQLSVSFGVIVRGRCWSCMGPAFRCRNPAADKRERLRTANRALLSVMDFFAIEAHARDAKLHVISLILIGRLRTGFHMHGLRLERRSPFLPAAYFPSGFWKFSLQMYSISSVSGRRCWRCV